MAQRDSDSNLPASRVAPGSPFKQRRGLAFGEHLRLSARRARLVLARIQPGGWYVPFGLALLVITCAVVAAYYINHPQPEVYPDTYTYLQVTQHILTRGQFVDPVRGPGYPLLIALVFVVAGQGNLAAVSLTQAGLFVLATLEVYAIGCLILRRAWAAFLIGMLVGPNVALLSFVKPILSEGLSLWLTVSLALATVLFVRTLRARYLWLVAACTLAIFMTRAEWTYVIVPLFAYLAVVAALRGQLMRVLPHASAAVVLLSLAFLGFVNANAAQTGFHGMTDEANVNLLGKVMQYHMQNEAPPQYSSATQIVNAYMARGSTDPYDIVDHEALFSRDYFAFSGEYATAIISHHPGEFLADSAPVAFSSLSEGYYARSQIDPMGPMASVLLSLQALFIALYGWNQLFALLVVVWAALLVWPRTARLPTVAMMSGIGLLSLYDLALTTVGGYDDYARFHVPFDPLLIVVVWGSILAGLMMLLPLVSQAQSWRWTGLSAPHPAGGAAVLTAAALPTKKPATWPARLVRPVRTRAVASKPMTWNDLRWSLDDFLPENASATALQAAWTELGNGGATAQAADVPGTPEASDVDGQSGRMSTSREGAHMAGEAGEGT